jgi:hypothetical protein
MRAPVKTRLNKTVAAAFMKRYTRTPEAARQILIAAGICTKSGKLTKNYR